MLVLNRNSTCFGRVYRRRASMVQLQHGEPMTAITQPEIDQQVFNLYDEYCHGRIDRREFVRRAARSGPAHYGAAADTGSVPKIKAPLLVHLAEQDPRINEMYPTYQEELKKAGVRHEIHMYPGTQHGFHNNSTPRNEAAAKLSWSARSPSSKRISRERYSILMLAALNTVL